MADVGLISAGRDENKKSLSPIFQKLGKTVIIVTPVLLFSNTALAAETTKCSKIIGELPTAVESLKKTRKAQKALEAVKKFNGYNVVCKSAFVKIFAHVGAEGTPLTALSAIVGSILMLACGSLLTIHVVAED
jgi:hypothetical protein